MVKYTKGCKGVKKRKRKRRNYTDARAKYLKTKYGISKGEYEELLSFQKGQCAICGRSFKHAIAPVIPNIDHDHKEKSKRKSIRGLLCGGRMRGCNRRLGFIESFNSVGAIKWMAAAIEYLKNPPAKSVLR